MIALALLLAVADPGVGAVAAPVVVSVVLADGKVVNVDEAAWAKLPPTTVTALEKDKTSHSYAGVDVAALLGSLGLPTGDKLRGAALGVVVVVEAGDGYKVGFGAAEFDVGLTGRAVVLARSRDGKALDPTHGPLQLIVPGDLRPTRWVRQVVRLRIVTP